MKAEYDRLDLHNATEVIPSPDFFLILLSSQICSKRERKRLCEAADAQMGFRPPSHAEFSRTYKSDFRSCVCAQIGWSRIVSPSTRRLHLLNGIITCANQCTRAAHEPPIFFFFSFSSTLKCKWYSTQLWKLLGEAAAFVLIFNLLFFFFFSCPGISRCKYKNLTRNSKNRSK